MSYAYLIYQNSWLN